MDASARSWLSSSTSHVSDWPVADLIRAKGRTTVSVVLPALDEERTVGAIVGCFRDLARRTELVDEIVVMDSGSHDATAAVATDAGARVHHRDDVLPAYGSRPGKGEVLWKSLAVTSGDIVVFCDSDLEDVGPEYVTGMLGPLLGRPGTSFVKACYDRPLRAGGSGPDATGGRVTELTARPLLNLCVPALAGVVQPLGGEYAGRRDLLESLPFSPGYGVDVGLLIDAWQAVGLGGLAQVDLDTRLHRHQPERALGRMAAEVAHAILTRCGVGHPAVELTQYHRADGGFVAEDYAVRHEDRPPMRLVAPR